LEATLIAMLEPVLNPLWVYLGTGETPSRWAILGGALIISAVSARTWLEQGRWNFVTSRGGRFAIDSREKSNHRDTDRSVL